MSFIDNCNPETDTFLSISINYLFKLKEYMNALGLDGFSIDIEQFSADWGRRAFDAIWRDREKWKGVLQKSIEYKRQSLSSALNALDAVPGIQ